MNPISKIEQAYQLIEQGRKLQDQITHLTEMQNRLTHEGFGLKISMVATDDLAKAKEEEQILRNMEAIKQAQERVIRAAGYGETVAFHYETTRPTSSTAPSLMHDDWIDDIEAISFVTYLISVKKTNLSIVKEHLRMLDVNI